MKQRAMTLLALAVLVASCSRDRESPVAGPEVVSRLALPDSRGQTFDPKTVAGKRLLVNFWSPSCASCVAEMPELQAAVDGRADTALVMVAIDGAPSRAEATVQANGVRAPVLIDQEMRLANELSITQVPTTLVVGPDGQTRRVLIGERDRAAFERALAEL